MFVTNHVTAVLFHQGYGRVAELTGEFSIALTPGVVPMVSVRESPPPEQTCPACGVTPRTCHPRAKRSTVQVWALMLMKFLQTQNSMSAPAGVVMFTCVFNVCLNYGFVQQYGFIGAAWATTTSRVLQVRSCSRAHGTPCALFARRSPRRAVCAALLPLTPPFLLRSWCSWWPSAGTSSTAPCAARRSPGGATGCPSPPPRSRPPAAAPSCGSSSKCQWREA